MCISLLSKYHSVLERGLLKVFVPIRRLAAKQAKPPSFGQETRGYHLRRLWRNLTCRSGLGAEIAATWKSRGCFQAPAKASSAGETQAIMVVRQLPPSESSRMRVSLESRYGMCCRGAPRLSVSAAITLPSALSDWLIFLLSSSRLPGPHKRGFC